MENVTGQETDTFDEVNKVLNKIIDNQNSLENRVSALETKKKKKKGAK